MAAKRTIRNKKWDSVVGLNPIYLLQLPGGNDLINFLVRHFNVCLLRLFDHQFTPDATFRHVHFPFRFVLVVLLNNLFRCELGSHNEPPSVNELMFRTFRNLNVLLIIVKTKLYRNIINKIKYLVNHFNYLKSLDFLQTKKCCCYIRGRAFNK